MALKMDMRKAYDRVEWTFLEKIMLYLGFAENWVRLVMMCITTMKYSVNVNGSCGMTFQPSRGLRQGDPLSPFLFLLCSKGLSALKRDAMNRGMIKGAKANRRSPSTSHLLFADDSLLFGETSERGAQALKHILCHYEKCSVRVSTIRNPLSSLALTRERWIRVVFHIFWGWGSQLLEKYLGFPNIVGRNKKASFQNLKDRIRMRIEGWSTRVLSQGDKEVFMKVVSQAIPTFAMNYFLLPKTFCKEIGSLLARFWWQEKHG